MIPENEMGVIVVFSQQAHEAGFEITSIRCDYPDAIIKKNERIYRTEFEYKSSNFNQHGHDLRECDLIICWINDTPGFALPILALSDPSWKLEDVAIPDSYKAEIAYWKHRALKAEKKEPREKRTQSGNRPLIRKRLPREERYQISLNILRENPLISGAELGRQLNTTDRTGQQILSELEQSGVIHRNGEGWKVIQ